MNMKQKFRKYLLPSYRCKKITDISPEMLQGAELVILDLDNTLVFSSTLTTTPEVLQWLADIKKRCHCVIFSNSFNFFKRAPQVAKLFGVELFLSRTKKPFKRLFKQMQKKYQVDSKKVFVVGDRIFTDILFGNSNGATTILVEPLSSKENILIKIVRIVENFTLYLGEIF
jgi:HAD superfamily phosphatase (TIGR01668 family)